MFAILSLVALWSASPAPTCQALTGTIDGRAEELSLGWSGMAVEGAGTVSGGLTGTMRGHARSARSDEPGQAYAVEVRVGTPTGPVRLAGLTHATSDGATVRHVDGWLDVRAAAGIRGRVRVTGSVDLVRRDVSLRYTGSLCR